jgi:hypothetical protein
MARALVFIGDAMKEEIEELASKARELGKERVPIFIFQEGRDPEFNPDRPRAVEQLCANHLAIAGRG